MRGQVGFHLYEYARHFATNCQRVLGVQYDSSSSGRFKMNVDGRDVNITCIHVGVDLPRVDEIISTDDFTTQVREWKGKFQNKIIVAGIVLLQLFVSCFVKIDCANRRIIYMRVL